MPAAPHFWLNPAFYMYVLAWLPFFLFVVLYAARSPWRHSATGRGLMAVSMAITAVLSFVLLIMVWPTMPDQIKDTIRAVLMGGVTIAGFLQLRNLVVLQKQRRDGVQPMRRSTD